MMEKSDRSIDHSKASRRSFGFTREPSKSMPDIAIGSFNRESQIFSIEMTTFW
jgi:hypothetical protein